MQSLDLDVLASAAGWRRSGEAVALATVLATYGSAPRPPGAIAAIRVRDGAIAGSVSGGCVEEELVARLARTGPPALPQRIVFGATREEAVRLQLPCGGTLHLLLETLTDPAWIDAVLATTAAGGHLLRELKLASGAQRLVPADATTAFSGDGPLLRQPFGPRWRLLLIGATDVAALLAPMAQALGYAVAVCDPRPGHAGQPLAEGVTRLGGSPDDAVLAFAPDAHSAILTLAHDPRLDDLALMEALASPAFYVGALGSQRTSQARRARLAEVGVEAAAIERLHAPVGLAIGSRTPAEIAVSILAELVAVRARLGQGGVQPQAAAPELAA
ncbi:MAG TPA: XdhC family protein [Plasticicumulans sp.]|uniref:XdhC family protein n=1 Tax=Plasticicumulans sp. TaxID=2307179 RepID=UPI002CA5DA79|nr:XdhC/CoxI family protein [Plasticicumulans sp.]HMW30239.1 XdhC family protein [Plasticicumulans sp.]